MVRSCKEVKYKWEEIISQADEPAATDTRNSKPDLTKVESYSDGQILVYCEDFW